MNAIYADPTDDGSIRARPDSVPVGVVEARIWKPFGPDKKEAWRFRDAVIEAAEKFDDSTKAPGARMGKIGLSGLKVLRILFTFADFMSGRLEPSIASIATRAILARGTVVRALARLRDAGFLWWIRRKETLDNDGPGPQIHQATNAYWFKLRGRAAGLVRLCLAKLHPPLPDDVAAHQDQEREAVADMLERTTAENVARFHLGDTALGDVLASLGRALDSSASSIEDRNPDRQE
jgi:hypothetical protein